MNDRIQSLEYETASLKQSRPVEQPTQAENYEGSGHARILKRVKFADTQTPGSQEGVKTRRCWHHEHASWLSLRILALWIWWHGMEETRCWNTDAVAWENHLKSTNKSRLTGTITMTIPMRPPEMLWSHRQSVQTRECCSPKTDRTVEAQKISRPNLKKLKTCRREKAVWSLTYNLHTKSLSQMSIPFHPRKTLSHPSVERNTLKY